MFNYFHVNFTFSILILHFYLMANKYLYVKLKYVRCIGTHVSHLRAVEPTSLIAALFSRT
jgi:hypothetical protein